MVPGKVVRRRRVNREDKPEHLVTYFNIKQNKHISSAKASDRRI